MLTDVRLQDDGGNGEELSGGRELNAVIQLFPMREESGLALVGRLKRRPFHRVHEHVHPLRGQQDHGHSWGTAAVTIRAKKWEIDRHVWHCTGKKKKQRGNTASCVLLTKLWMTFVRVHTSGTLKNGMLRSTT